MYLESHKSIPQLRIIRCSKTRSRVPSRHSRESVSFTSRVGPIRNIIECVGVGVEHRVQEPHWTGLTGCDTLIDNTVDDGCDDGGRGGGTSFNDGVAIDPDGDSVSNGGDVGVTAAGPVVETAVFAEDGAVVGWVGRGVVGKVAGANNMSTGAKYFFRK